MLTKHLLITRYSQSRILLKTPQKEDSMHVLLVEDNRDLAASVADYLLLEDIQCDHAYSGTAGLNLASQQYYDVILLDLMLPGKDGITVCNELRQQGVDTPILMLTARDTLDDKISGFRAGTDDYLVKPFDLEELVMRIHALAKRRSGQIRQLRVVDIEMDLNNKTVTRAGQLLSLTPTCWVILETLMRAAPNVVSRTALEKAIWPDDEQPDSNTLKVHLYKLRKQLDRPFDKPLLQTVSGHGFALREEDT